VTTRNRLITESKFMGEGAKLGKSQVAEREGAANQKKASRQKTGHFRGKRKKRVKPPEERKMRKGEGEGGEPFWPMLWNRGGDDKGESS